LLIDGPQQIGGALRGKVLHDGIGFPQHKFPVTQGWDDAVGIDGQVTGFAVLVLEQID